MMNSKFFMERVDYGRRIGLSWITSDGKSRASEFVYEPIKEGEYSPPLALLSMNEAQNLMDELWQCGMRPTEGRGSAGSLAATQEHLEDMRKLAFHKIIGKQ